MMSTLVSEMFLRMSEVTPLPVEWVWEGLVPRRSLTLLTGDPGIGKSLVTLQVAAMVTRGVTNPRDLTPWLASGKPATGDANQRANGANGKLVGGAKGKPAGGANGNSDGMPTTPEEAPHPNHSPRKAGARGFGTSPLGSLGPLEECSTGVLVLSAADQPRETVLPRLIAAGADPSQVFFLNGEVVDDSVDDLNARRVVRPFRLSQDIDKLEWCLMELSDQGIDVGLIVIDSVDRYLGTDDKKSARIDVVAQLSDLAAKADLAVLVTANTSMKAGSRGGTVVYQELMNTARSVLMVAPDLEDLDRRLVLPVKHNLTGRPPGLSFTVSDAGVEWGTEPLDLSIEEYRLQSRRNEKLALVSDDGQEIQRAANWLKDELAQEAAPSELVQRRASQVHLSYGTLRRAFKLIGGKVRKQKNQWFWSLPEDEAERESSAATGNVLVI